MERSAAAPHFASLCRARRAVLALLLCAITTAAHAQGFAPAPNVNGAIELTEALVIESVGRYGRAPIHLDAIEHQMLLGNWHPPIEGDAITAPDGTERIWSLTQTDENGWLRGRELRGGYVYWSVESPADRIMILNARGPSATCVNGAWRVGDVYQTGWSHIPISLHEGRNDILFHVARGGLKASLREPTGSVEFNTAEITMPTLVVGEPFDTLGAVVVINASNDWLRGLTMHVDCPSIPMHTLLPVPDIPPCSIRKVPFALEGDAPAGPNSHELSLHVVNEDEESLADASAMIRVVTRNDVIVRTFISEIDGSVQYYGLREAKEEHDDGDEPRELKGLILSLHGAGVEAGHQASCYKPKSWAHLVTPTNRRPFGFDWEDWGRLDALEVLDIALASLDVDPNQVAVTGHSMGGHGTWHLATRYPEKFVAAAPSAGWVSFWSYAGAQQFETNNPIESILHRATEPSQTLEHLRNLADLGVYVLHGEKDDNVPVEQARIMRRALAEFHTDFAYYEEPGAGHWWGNQCMDYPALMAFIRERMEKAKDRETDESQQETSTQATRPGPFKDAFRNNMLFVIGTIGTNEENAVNFNKARYDAETFWYRGNGSVDMVIDRDFNPDEHPDRNIILYGNADTNLAWNTLLADSPVQVRRGTIEFGDRTLKADDLACIMIRPRPRNGASRDADPACIAVISGTDAQAMQLTMRLPVFVSGVAYPDLMIWSSDALLRGNNAILAAGYFGDDWSIDAGEFAWRD